MNAAFTIPQLEGEPLRWDYFMIQAARGSVHVPDWVLLAVPCLVGERFGLAPSQVTEAHIEQLAADLPEDPAPVLRAMLRGADIPLPTPQIDQLQLDEDQVCGHRRAPVGFPALAHDAALLVQQNYHRDGFFAAFDAVSEDEWDARYAVAAVMYLMIGRALV